MTNLTDFTTDDHCYCFRTGYNIGLTRRCLLIDAFVRCTETLQTVQLERVTPVIGFGARVPDRFFKRNLSPRTERFDAISLRRIDRRGKK